MSDPEQPKKKRRVLVVDDDQISVYALRLALEDEGYEVSTAKDVPSALQKAEEAGCDILVTDIGLPNGSGTDLVHRLCQPNSIPAIAMTGYDPQQLAERTDVRFDGHITKPVDHKKLFSLIERLLSVPHTGPQDLPR